MSAYELKNKTVLVVGGSAGIGLEVAKIAVELGANVHVASRGKTKVNKPLSQATYHECDAKSEASLSALFRKLDRVDHVAMTVHESAARLGIDTTADKMNLSAAMEYADGKFWSQYRVVKAALPHLAPDGSITLSSGVASRGTMANHSAISAVNASIEACARQLAKELAPRRMNVVAPGVHRDDDLRCHGCGSARAIRSTNCCDGAAQAYCPSRRDRIGLHLCDAMRIFNRDCARSERRTVSCLGGHDVRESKEEPRPWHGAYRTNRVFLGSRT